MIIGIDEVGRGCWAGPLVVAAVGLPQHIPGLADSKKLSEQKRKQLDKEIRSVTKDVYVAAISAAQIDDGGLSAALQLACVNLFSQFSKQQYSKIIIDGAVNFLPDKPRSEAVVRADQHIPECMAASIVAKVWRDDYMREIAREYPQYGFENHVGYGTKQHTAALERFGPCEEHRYSFRPIRTYDEQRQQG